MDQMEAAQLARLNDLMDTLIPSISQEDAPPALVALFTYMTENPDLCQALYGKSWESEFTRNAKKLIAERCLGEFAPDGGTEEQKYMLAFAVNGCFGTIVAWQEAGFRPPAGGDRPHHLAGHPRCEGADVERSKFPLPALPFGARRGII